MARLSKIDSVKYSSPAGDVESVVDVSEDSKSLSDININYVQ